MHAENTVLFNSIKIPKSLLYIKKCIETGLSVPLYVFSLMSEVMKRTWKILQSGGLNFSDDEIDGVQVQAILSCPGDEKMYNNKKKRKTTCLYLHISQCIFSVLFG